MKYWIGTVISLILIIVGIHFQSKGSEFVAGCFLTLPLNIMYYAGLLEGKKSV